MFQGGWVFWSSGEQSCSRASYQGPNGGKFFVEDNELACADGQDASRDVLIPKIGSLDSASIPVGTETFFRVVQQHRDRDTSTSVVLILREE